MAAVRRRPVTGSCGDTLHLRVPGSSLLYRYEHPWWALGLAKFPATQVQPVALTTPGLGRDLCSVLNCEGRLPDCAGRAAHRGRTNRRGTGRLPWQDQEFPQRHASSEHRQYTRLRDGLVGGGGSAQINSSPRCKLIDAASA